MKRVLITAALCSCYWPCVIGGKPRGSKRPLETTTPTAWQAFDEHLKSFVPEMATAAFDAVYKPYGSGFKERELNDLAAKALQQEVVNSLEAFSVDVGVFFWDNTYPDEVVGIAKALGVIDYNTCLHPPEDKFDEADNVMPQPCGEGGSVSTYARSTIFAYWVVQPKRPLPPIRKTKRVTLFYTPHNVWSLLSLPAIPDPGGPTTEPLVKALDFAMRTCQSSLMVGSGDRKISPGSYAACLWRYYNKKVSFDDHTGLRGLVVVPEILEEVKRYSPPGRSMPNGYIIEIPVELPARVRQQISLKMKMWVFVNIPVVVSSLDCHALLWDECD